MCEWHVTTSSINQPPIEAAFNIRKGSMNLEGFKQVEGFPDYLISEYGQVWDTRQNKELKWIKNNDFNCVNMYNTGG